MLGRALPSAAAAPARPLSSRALCAARPLAARALVRAHASRGRCVTLAVGGQTPEEMKAAFEALDPAQKAAMAEQAAAYKKVRPAWRAACGVRTDGASLTAALPQAMESPAAQAQMAEMNSFMSARLRAPARSCATSRLGYR
jgi:hypothetical protein